MKAKNGQCLFFVWFLLGINAVSFAQVHTVSPEDFLVDRFFTTENGLPANGVNELLQDRRGYLWAATYNGLVKFDGNRFVLYNTGNLPGLENNRFVKITEDEEGKIWAGLEHNNLVMIGDDTTGVFKISEQKIGSNQTISAIVPVSPNEIWLGTSRGVVQFNGTDFFLVENLPKQYVQEVKQSGEYIYVLYANYLYRMKKDFSEKTKLLELDGRTITNQKGENHQPFPYNIERFRALVFKENFFLLITEAGILQIGEELFNVLLTKEEAGVGLIHGMLEREDGFYIYGSEGVVKFSDIYNNGERSVYANVRTIHAKFDNEGSLWLATTARGLLQKVYTPVYQGDDFAVLREQAITPVFEDRAGNIWVGTNCDGLYKFEPDKNIQHYDVGEGILNSCIWSLHEQSDGTMWVGTWGHGVFYRAPGMASFQHFEPDVMQQAEAILSIFEDASGNMWFGSYRNGLFRYDGETTVRVDSEQQGHMVTATRMIYQDENAGLMVATDQGIGVYDGEKITIREDLNVLETSNYRVIKRDSSGRYWFGNYGGGVVIKEPGKAPVPLTPGHGLYDNTVSQIEFDAGGNVWLAGNQGIFFIEKPEIDQFINGEKSEVQVVRIGIKEGLPIRETSGGFMPSSVLTDQGFMFIPTVQGLAVLDVNRIHLNRQPPHVYIEHIDIDNNIYHPEKVSQIRFDTQRINFLLTAPNFKNSDYVEFQYMLEGFDSDWIELTEGRSAAYTSIPPGQYTFRAKASNSDGFWNEEGTSVSFTVPFPFWQSAWFFAAIILAVFLLILLYIRIRLRRIKTYNEELQQMVEKHTKQLQNTNKELKKLIAEKDKLHSILAHDLRHPFTSMIGYIDLLRQIFKEEGDDENLEMTEALLNSGNNTLNLLENLLDWSNTNSKGMKPAYEETEMNALIFEAIKMTQIQANYKEVEIIFEKKPDAWIRADRNMMLSVIRNLLSNAIKFSERGSQIHIAISATDDEIYVRVKDSGVGISGEEIRNIFSKNGIHHKPGTQGEKGIGLGLQLCKEFLQAHGGKIWAESIHGRKSTFTFMVPRIFPKTSFFEKKP